MEHTVNTKFYTFSQNNSGGAFVKSDKEGISECVIIEALEVCVLFRKIIVKM